MDIIRNAIGGTLVQSGSTRKAPVFNPATGEQIAELPLSSAAEVETAIAAAKAALPAWRDMPPLKRARVMFKFKELLSENADHIAREISREHGKTHDDALGEVARGIEVVEFCCGIPHLLKGEFARNVGPAIDSLLRPAAARRRRRHHAVQLSGHGADVDVSSRNRLRQHLRPEAVGTRSLRRHGDLRVDGEGGACRTACSTSCTATRRRSIRC